MEAIAVKKLSLKVKLAGGFGALLVALALMGFAGYSAIEKLSVFTDEMSKQMQKKQYALDVDGGVELQTSSTRGYLLSGKDDVLKRRDEGIAEFDTAFPKLQALLQTEAGKAVASRIESDSKELRQLQQHAIDLRRAGNQKAAAESLFTEDAIRVRADLEKSVEDLKGLIEKLQEKALKEHEDTEAATVRYLLTLLGAGVLVGVVVSVLIVRSI